MSWSKYRPQFNESFQAQLDAVGGLPKTGKVFNLFAVHDDYPIVSLVGMCDKDTSATEERSEKIIKFWLILV